ncbi:hypothetical protein ATY81_08585 [Rhizobium sp. R72]|nr:hypothetical protein ATY81_08585 [Rhizobium sp. R72]OWV97809.1 hypothetical protein ATY80_08585 [Rhizobium sp. R711]
MEDSHSRRFASLMWTGMASCQCLQGFEVEASTLLSHLKPQEIEAIIGTTLGEETPTCTCRRRLSEDPGT